MTVRVLSIIFLLALSAACSPLLDYQVGRQLQLQSMKPAPPSEDYAVVAEWIAQDLDQQLSARMGLKNKSNAYSKQWVVITVPSNLNDLSSTSALARIMAEEIGSRLTQRGYYVEEIRKGADLTFKQDQGEMLLTRKKSDLATQHPVSTLIVSGTYLATNAGVRFNIKVLSAENNDVLASSSRSVPPSSTVTNLSMSEGEARQIKPSVITGPARKTSTQNMKLYDEPQ